MKVVIAIDSFKGSLTSLEAGNSAAAGVRRVFPDAEYIVRPLADGGEGTVDALVAACEGKKIEISVTGPLGEPVLCQYGLIEKTKTAIIEMSGAAGITLVPASKRNPLFTTTYGVGEVIRDAIEKGCSHFIIGIGGSATNDGGAGMLQALGFSLLDKNGTPIRSGALGLKDLASINDKNALLKLKDCTFRIACDVTNQPSLRRKRLQRRFRPPERSQQTHDSGDGSVARPLRCPGSRKIPRGRSLLPRSRSCRRPGLCFSNLPPWETGIRHPDRPR